MTADQTGLQPAAPPAAEPRDGDAALYARLVAVGFTGPDYDTVADALARYAYPILRAWLTGGQIVQECARKGVPGIRRLAAGEVRLGPHDTEDLLQDTLLAGLRRFARAGQAGRGWSPHGGAALTTYFLGGCVFAFGDVYRSWERRHQHDGPPLDPDTARSHLPVDTETDPANLAVLRETLEESLPPPGRARTAVLLSAAGYTHAEIARILADGTTERAVEGLIHRHRKAMKGGPRS